MTGPFRRSLWSARGRLALTNHLWPAELALLFGSPGEIVEPLH